MHTIHDAGYKKLFSNKTIFRELIETFVHEAWVNDLDFDHCEPLDKSFIADHYKETESDLIYRINFRGREAYLVILLEFQSKVDRFMALRVLNYLTNFYLDYAASNKRVKKLPPVFPIVLYNGAARWTAPVKFETLIENAALLGKYAPQFEYCKIAEREYSKKDLLQIRNIVSTLFLAEAHFDLELLKQEFVAVFPREDRQAVSLFFNWLRQLFQHGYLGGEAYHELEDTYHTIEEVNTMLLESIRKDRQQLLVQGGLEGKLEGKREEQYEIAQRMLAKGLSITLITELTQLSSADIEQLRKKTEQSGSDTPLPNQN